MFREKHGRELDGCGNGENPIDEWLDELNVSISADGVESGTEVIGWCGAAVD